MESKGNLQ